MEKEKIKHGDDGFPFQIYRNSTEGGYSYYYHWHNELEIILVTKGTILAVWNNNQRKLNEGDVLIFNKGEVHNLIDCGVLSSWEAFVFDYNFLSSMISDKAYEKYILPLIENKSIIYNFIDQEEIKAILIDLSQCYFKNEKFKELKIKSLLFDLFFTLYQNNLILSNTLKETANFVKIKQAIDFISKHYSENIRVSDIANACYLNEYYFMRIFKKNMNMTVNEYLNQYRLVKANHLLKQTNKSVTEIAYQVGFNNVSYFIVKLKEMYNKTPKELRNE